MNSELISDRLEEIADLILRVRSQTVSITAAVDALVAAYERGNKLLLCGNGGSAADAQHIAGEMTGRFLRERKAWPAIALHCNTSILTAITNDYGPEFVFARQIEALGSHGDVLWAISTTGRSQNCVQAMRTAKDMGLVAISSVGGNGGEMVMLSDICLLVPSCCTPRVQEAHIALAHIICELVELRLTD